MNTEVTTAVLPTGMQEFEYTFRTEKIRDDKGEIIGEGKKTPAIKVILPVPTDEDVINFIAANGPEAKYLREVIYSAIKDTGRGQINEFVKDNPDIPVTADILNLSKLTFAAIANTAPESRAKPEIPEEVYNTFYEDYKQVMVAAGKELNRVLKHIVLFKVQFRTCKSDKPALNVLKQNINLWAVKTQTMDDNKEVFEVLTKRLDKLLAAEEKDLVAAL